MGNIKQIEYLIKTKRIMFPHISVLTPYPGTELYEQAQEYGIEIIEKKFSKYYMNCDVENYGLPVFQTNYLSRYQIYSMWLLALATAMKSIKQPDVTYVNQYNTYTDYVRLIN